LKRIWKLPVNTHNYVVNALNDKIPIFDELCSRTISFVASCITSCNVTVRNVAHYACTVGLALSPLGRNALFLSGRYNLTVDQLKYEKQVCRSHLVQYCNLARMSCNINVNTLFEILMIRDGVFDFEDSITFYSRQQLEDIICQLCTS
jgi:hypothetical protein